jgi:hypothetical protein
VLQGSTAVLSSVLEPTHPPSPSPTNLPSPSTPFPKHTQDLAHLLASQRRLTHLTLHEVHELEELDTLDPASLWDVLVAAVPVLARRLQVLRVAGCFWNQPELFGGLRQLTALTELRCASGSKCERALVFVSSAMGTVAATSDLSVREEHGGGCWGCCLDETGVLAEGAGLDVVCEYLVWWLAHMCGSGQCMVAN